MVSDCGNFIKNCDLCYNKSVQNTIKAFFDSLRGWANVAEVNALVVF